jgi:hypothetical protein
MESLRKGLSILAAAALLAPAGGALAGRPVFQRHHENHEGDDDRGGKPTKTTVSDLTLRSRALLGKDGKTQFEVSTAPFDSAGTPPGNISRVHVRAVDPSRPDGDGDDDDKDGKDGKERRFRREYNHLRGGGYFTNEPADPWTGLPHGQNLRIEAKARGAVHRDELEARWLDTVRYRPDLYVKMVVAPAQARINTVVTVDGIIGEGMGETGADTDCALLVDGAQVDTGLLWVNAGGAATCEFQYAFATAGLHTVAVRAQNVRPGDYDDSNNTSAPRQILITQPFFAHYDATVSETTKIRNMSTDSYLLSASATPNQELKTFSTTIEQVRSFFGVLPGDVNPDKVRVTFNDSSGNRDLSSFDLAGLTIGAPEPSALPACATTSSVMDLDTATGRCVTLSRCTNAAGANSTSVLINYPGTQVTTFSENICRTSNIGCKVGDFVTAPKVTVDHPLVQLADDYSAVVQVEDAASGTFTAKPTMSLAPFVLVPLNTMTLQPCRPFNGAKGKQCTVITTNIYGKAGQASKDNAE